MFYKPGTLDFGDDADDDDDDDGSDNPNLWAIFILIYVIVIAQTLALSV